MTSIKRKALSLEDKIKILEVFDAKSQTKNQTELAAELNLPVSTLRTILKNRYDIEEKYTLGGVKRKKQKAGKFDNLEKVLLDWLHQARVLNLPINGPVLCEKAREIAESLQITDFTGSNGWLNRFKNRHDIVYRRISGGSEVEVEKEVDTLTEQLVALSQNYEPRDIFNADEFGLFYKLMPDKYHDFEGDICDDGKASKERITVLACANSDGSERLRLLVIGKADNPRSFRNVKSFPVTYDAHSLAWMTELRFIDWLKALDDHFHIEKRRIILIIDDCPIHPKNVELKNIKLVFLPTKLQPMEQGIIKVLKQGYRTRLIHLNDDTDSKCPLTLHDAILNIAAAWQAIKPETIQNSFMKSFQNENADVVEEPEILEDFPGYSSFDDNVAPYPIKDLTEDVNTQKDAFSDEDDDEESTPILSKAQALSAVNSLRRYVSTLGESEMALENLSYVENLIITNVSKPLIENR